jgi:hypothetical protein
LFEPAALDRFRKSAATESNRTQPFCQDKLLFAITRRIPPL